MTYTTLSTPVRRHSPLARSARGRPLLGLLTTVALLLIFAAVWTPAAPAAPSWVAGDLDLAFSAPNGRVQTTFAGLDRAHAVAEAGGKIIAVGSTFYYGGPDGWETDWALARYNSDGTLDTSFDDDGKLTLDFGGPAPGHLSEEARGVAIQADGRIVAAGWAGRYLAVARFQTNGEPDDSFDHDGKVRTLFDSDGGAEGHAVAIQPNGKIVAAGWKSNDGHRDFAVARYHSNGDLDRSFDYDGKVVTGFGGQEEAHALAIKTSGGFVTAIVAAGESSEDGGPEEFAVARYDTFGELDKSFDDDGKVETRLSGHSASANAVEIQANGRIVAAGSRSRTGDEDFQLVRYRTDGTLDGTFDDNGTQATEFGGNEHANALAIQPDGKIVAVGVTTAGFGGTIDFALARYDALGELDHSFGRHETGKVTTHFADQNEGANAVDIQADGNIVAAGWTSWDFALTRYHGAAS